MACEKECQKEFSVFKDLMSRMHSLWKQRQLCDVQLHVENSIVPAHRVVLAALSPYFRAMFCSELNESQQSSVTIQGFSFATVCMIVEFAYTSAVQLNEDNVQNYLHAASIMQIESLERLCTQFLSEHLHPSNCLGIRGIAHLLGCCDLSVTADRFCQNNFYEVSQNEEFLQLPASEVTNLVARDALKVRKEEEVYTAVIRWFEYSPGDRAEDMVKIMEKVRLPLVQWEFLRDKVRKHELFTTNEQCQQFLQEARAFQASIYHPDLINFAFNQAAYLAQPRSGYGATDYLYVVGGETTNRELLPMVEEFSPATNSVKLVSPLPTPRRSLGVVIVDNRIFAVGGSDGQGAVRTVEIYDIEKSLWRDNSSLREPRTSVAAAILEGQVFAIGGHDGQRALSSVEKYESVTNCWDNTAELQTPRCMSSAVCLKNKLYVLGGYDGSVDLCSVEKLENRQLQWVFITSMHEARSMCDAAVLDDQIIVVGGNSGTECLSSAEMYSPISAQWTVVQSLSSPRRGLGVAVMGGVLYAAGGHDGKKHLSSVEKFKPNEGWMAAGELADCRSRFGIA